MKNKYSIQDVISITGVTKRTLHYYDEIGLLTPSKNLDNQYREYSESELAKLQKILFLKGLDVPLKEIKPYLELTDQELSNKLENYADTINHKIKELTKIQENLESFLTGTSFEELDLYQVPVSEQYQREAKIKYGETEIYKSYENKGGEKNVQQYAEKLDIAFKKFKDAEEQGVPIQNTQEIVQEWRGYLMAIADYTDEVLTYIAKGYDEDERFKAYFDKFDNPRLTKYIQEAVAYHLS